tara:strand:+ start:30 stop:209 length:180 start_codon:yes stop_codon:yes gene_type:complete
MKGGFESPFAFDEFKTTTFTPLIGLGGVSKEHTYPRLSWIEITEYFGDNANCLTLLVSN